MNVASDIQQVSLHVEGFALSPQQRDLWVRAEETGEPVPEIRCAVTIDGDLDRDALRRAVAGVVARHEILRTGFHLVPGLTLPIQVITPAADVPADALIREAGGSPFADAVISDEGGSAFAGVEAADDLTRASLLRAELVRRSASEHTLLLSLPALCADVPGMAALAREIVTHYGDGAATSPADQNDSQYADLAEQGEPQYADLAEQDAPQYADLAEWMNELLTSPDAEAGAEFWQRQTAGGPPLLPFLRETGSSEIGSRKIGSREIGSREIGEEGTMAAGARVPVAERVWEHAGQVARRLAVPPRAVLTAFWAMTLYRYTRQQAMTLTVACAGRDHQDLRDGIGPVGREVPMGVELADDLPLTEAVRRVALLDAELRDFAFSYDAGRTSAADPGRTPTSDAGRTPTADAGRTPVAGHQVAIGHDTVEALPAGRGVRFSIASLERSSSLAPLELRCVELPGTTLLTIEHCPRRYAAADVRALAASLAVLAEHAALEPETEVGSLRLTLAEKAGAHPPAWKPALVHEQFERHASATPHAPAVTFEGDRLTYGELRERAYRTAGTLAAAGVRPGELVPVLADRGTDAIAAVLGVLMAGAAYVPVEPDTPANRIAFICGDVSARVALAPSRLAGRLPAGVRHVELEALREPGDAEPPTAVVNAGDPAYVIYTSGTTGTPKGVVVEHGQIAHYVMGVTGRLGAPVAGSFAMVSTLAADLGNTALFHALCGGGTLHVISKDRASDPDGLAAYLRAEAVDRMKIVPSHLRALLDSATRPADLLPRVTLVLGGEPLTHELAGRIAELGSCALVNHYGPTETTVGATTYAVAEGVDARCRTVPVGRPFGGTRLLLLDPARNPVPDWVPGEAYVSGPQVARGYLNRPDVTAERFLTLPSGERAYRTGDLLRRLPGGALEFLGRVDDQVKIRGYRVEPGEVEAVIRTYPGVHDVAVLARQDGAGDRHLAAYVAAHVPGHEASPAAAGLREFLHERLPDHMVPATIEVLGALPLTPNGKVDRKALLAREPQAAQPSRPVVAPRDEEEARLLAVWQDTLNNRSLGVTDDFFEVGGNSLLAVRLIAQIRRATGHALPLSALFPSGTVESMARLLREDPGAPEAVIVPINRGGTRQPFFCVHAGGGTALGYRELARDLGPDQPFYALQSPGLNGGELLTSLPEMAAEYVKAMRAVQPEGPYLIGGWCLGGIIAYEMTCVLRAQNQRTALLVLIDSDNPLTAEASAGRTEPTEDVLVRRFAWHFGIDGLLRPDLAALTSDERLDHLLDVACEHGVLPAGAGRTELGHLLRVYGNNIRAVEAYLDEFTPGELPDHPVVLYRPIEELAGGQDAGFGWPALVADRLTVEVVSGDHHSVMRAPAVSALAGRIGTLLGRLTGREG
ncbi:amino acid adenylation domain-containing protein [Nonomuraea monospora]|uniref:Amino acid adenylation domain-containing protein n=1 Tax=Nonomuraea monospora TaxID=568818 RepID=A0ABN3D5L4_9ACTN